MPANPLLELPEDPDANSAVEHFVRTTENKLENELFKLIYGCNCRSKDQKVRKYDHE